MIFGDGERDQVLQTHGADDSANPVYPVQKGNAYTVSMGTDHQNRRLWRRLQADANEEVEELVQRLPAELRDKARAIPVTYEPFVTQAMLDDDKLNPDLLGLFVGNDYAEVESGVTDLPPQILLFLMSLWDYADHRSGDFREEVRRTYLHELGHYLGLDEGDLELRDLD